MKKTILLLSLFLNLYSLKAQVMYGTTTQGGEAGLGTINKLVPGTNSCIPVFDFVSHAGTHPENLKLLQASDGKLYGMTSYGGVHNGGGIFSFAPSSGTYTELRDFDSPTGSEPSGSLIQASDGKLYGMTFHGGIDDKGVVFSFDPSTLNYTVLKYFNETDGFGPHGSLMDAYNGKLYGMTAQGGTNGEGVIFSLQLSNLQYIKLKDFTGTDGANPYGGLLNYGDGKLYGMTSSGGAKGNGVIFSFALSSSTYKKLVDFKGSNGSNPDGSLIVGFDGRIFGLTSFGGASGKGVMFAYYPGNGNSVAVLKDFNAADGEIPLGDLMQTRDGKLYGLTFSGGTYSDGVIFSYNPASSSYTKLTDFDGAGGAAPRGTLMSASDGKLYAVTGSGGGSDNSGVIFSFDPSTSAYTKLKVFYDQLNSLKGSAPASRLLYVSDGKIYGTTSSGGIWGKGVVFSFNPSSAEYNVLKDFNGADGANPWSGLTQASNGLLYGMTAQGGSNNDGVIFSLQLSNLQYIKLKDFTGANGENPTGDLVQASDGKLYGTAKSGGTGGNGTLFSVNPANSKFIKIRSFSDAVNGSYPQGSLVKASNGKLYGTTQAGGDYGKGAIFSFDPATSTYIKVYSCDDITGGYPFDGLALGMDGKLYGTTSASGSAYNGALFSFDIASGIAAKVFEFNGTNGTSPKAVTQGADGKLYGVTGDGGSSYKGVAFSYDLSSSVYTKIVDFTGSNGDSPQAAFTQVNCGGTTYYRDADGDGYGNARIHIQLCQPEAGYVTDSTDCNDRNADVHSGTIPPKPTISGSDILCTSSTAKLSSSNASTYLWNTGETTKNITVTSPGAYTVAITKANGCGNVSDTFIVNANPCQAPANLYVEQYFPTSAILEWDGMSSVTSFTLRLKPVGSATWQVYPGITLPIFPANGLTPGTNYTWQVQAVYSKSGSNFTKGPNFKAITKPLNGVAAQSNLSTGKAFGFSVSPNPASTIVHIVLDGYNGNVVIRLMDMEGKQLVEQKVEKANVSVKQDIDISHIANGVYLVTLIDENGNRSTQKLVIAK